MKRRLFLIIGIVLLLCGCGGSDELGPFSGKSYVQPATGLGNGWNLGNTLDACYYGDKSNAGLGTETSWGAPTTTQAMIQAVATKGFKTIRIPVSWHNHITEETNYTIDSDWMARVKTVVDWSLAAGMSVIINIHHDNLTENQMSSTYGFCVPESASSPLKAKSREYIVAIWKQVAAAFKEYDERLVFELLNEPRCVGTSYEWYGSGSPISNANKIICEYEKAALDAIRAVGGKNVNRTIMIPPYVASPGTTSGWSLPADTGTGKLIISMHAYTPSYFCLGDSSGKTYSERGSVDNLFNTQLTAWTREGYSVVIGEMGASDKNNLSEREKWFTHFCGKARDSNIPVILWDNMTIAKESGGNGNINSGECHGYLNRNARTWYFPTLINEMVK